MKQKNLNLIDIKNYFLAASRLVPYKKIDLIIKAFNLMPEYNLVVCGSGDQFNYYKKISKQNIILKGWVTDKSLIKYLSKAKAFIFAAKEDFGILPVEALSSGTPVIAYNKGGTKETISSKKFKCGVLYKKQNISSIINAVKKFHKNANKIKSFNCVKQAKNFSVDIFQSKLRIFINKKSKFT